MRRFALVLTLLALAAPAWATVTITTEIDDANDSKIWIGYTSDEAELIRAFALDIVAIDGNIIAISDYAVGDDNGGYGIFPGSFAAAPITVNPTTGEVESWAVAGYTPIAPPGAPDARGGIGTSGVTIEMGSLYDTAAPSPTEGILCSVTVDCDVTELCVTANAIRGNVVLESAAEVHSLVLPDGGPAGCLQFSGGCGHECITTSHPDYAMWVTLGKPNCWCCPYQCLGDADCSDSGMPFRYRIYIGDLSIVIDNWKKKARDAGLNPCADLDHKDSGMPFKYQVYIGDLTILVDNWKKKDSAFQDDCFRILSQGIK